MVLLWFHGNAGNLSHRADLMLRLAKTPAQVFIVDYRFLFPFASDLTPYRAGMWLLYFPFLLAGFTLTLLMILAIDLFRLQLTGTWGAFPLG